MRAVICRHHGGPDQLVVDELPSPEPGPGEVRIRVRAAGVNFADTLIIAGSYQVKPPLPFVPGFEVAGEIEACGPDVRRLQPGERVLAVVPWGAFAEQVVALATNVYPLPADVDDVVAAGFAVAYGTSHLALRDRAKLQAGETLLVHGAAGGVGLSAVEIGKRIGATVIATAGGADKLKVAAEFGADHLIDYRREDIRERVKALTGGEGVDVVYDPVGGSAFEASLRCTRPDGRLLVVGFASGTIPQIPANLLLVKNLTVIGLHWGAYREFAPERMEASFRELLDWLAAGEIRPHVSHTFPLDQAPEALAQLRERRSTGKIVLTV